MIKDGIILLLGTALIVFTSYHTKLEPLSYKPKIQPKNGAFSIWAIIFASLFISSIFVLIENINYLLPVLLCSASLVCCSVWLFISEKIQAVYLLISATIFACICSLTFLQYRNIHFIILLGPNLLFSWLTIASSLGIIIHLKIFYGFDEKVYFIIPPILLNFVVFATTTLHENYIGAIFIIFPLFWTLLFSDIHNFTLFSIPVFLEIGFILGFFMNQSICVSQN